MECTVNNDFHRSHNGCELFVDEQTNKLFHRFRGTKCSINPNGTPLINNFVLSKNTLTIKFPLNSLTAQVECGPLIGNENFNMPLQISLEHYITTDTCFTFIKQCFEDYATIYYTDEQNTKYVMQLKNFLDVFFQFNTLNNRYDVVFFRPVQFEIENNVIYKQWRDAILRLLQMCRLNFTTNKTALSKRKNTKSCTFSRLSERPAPHMRCGEYLRGKDKVCSHLSFFSVINEKESLSAESEKKIEECLDGKYSKNMLCSRVLAIIQHNKSVGLMNKINHRCNLTELANVTTHVFGRKEVLHSILCCPDVLINDKYNKSIKELFFTSAP